MSVLVPAFVAFVLAMLISFKLYQGLGDKFGVKEKMLAVADSIA